LGLRAISTVCSNRSQQKGSLGHDDLDASNGRRYPKFSGGDFEKATPDPIPNSEVKLFGANGTAREAVWESRTLPGFTYDPQELTLLRVFFFARRHRIWSSGKITVDAALQNPKR
jgi:hypothetical protein